MSRSLASHVRTALTLILLISLVVVGSFLAWRALTAPVGVGAGGIQLGAPCAPAAGKPPPEPRAVEVDVFNGTTRNGLGAQVARQLRERGFVILEIANAPAEDRHTGVAEVRSSLDSQAEAAVLMAQFPGATYRPDNRTTSTVEVILGDAFRSLRKEGASYSAPKGVPKCTTLEANMTPTPSAT